MNFSDGHGSPASVCVWVHVAGRCDSNLGGSVLPCIQPLLLIKEELLIFLVRLVFYLILRTE